jgi:hypothetical protein
MVIQYHKDRVRVYTLLLLSDQAKLQDLDKIARELR